LITQCCSNSHKSFTLNLAKLQGIFQRGHDIPKAKVRVARIFEMLLRKAGRKGKKRKLAKGCAKYHSTTPIFLELLHISSARSKPCEEQPTAPISLKGG
jgi:hypothetical protein